MKPVEPIFLTELFAEIHTELLVLLRSLGPEDWEKPTAAGAWRVRDIAAHLLDGDLRRLSFQRDQMTPAPPEKPIESYQDLVGYLNQLNADWTRAARRLSPRLVIDFLSMTGSEVATLFRSLDPFGPALFGVAWAGEQASPNWFDIAREYTEKWHHQQQIREAVGAPGLNQRKWLFPVLDAFLRGLPHSFRDKTASEKTQIVFQITGEAGGDWTLQCENAAWTLYTGQGTSPACTITMDQDVAWRLLTKGLSRDQAISRITVAGDQNLGQPIFSMLAVMA
jgi:uncharacterized protein (TIGR03083 family)